MNEEKELEIRPLAIINTRDFVNKLFEDYEREQMSKSENPNADSESDNENDEREDSIYEDRGIIPDGFFRVFPKF